MVVGDNKHLTCVGDEDQLIYQFRGADGEFIHNFDKIYKDSKILMLKQNYRSTKNILNLANNLISHNKKRKCDKKLWTNNDEGAEMTVLVCKNQEEEIEAICDQIKQLHLRSKVPLEDIAVLSRTNQGAKDFERMLIANNIPYELGPSIQRFLEKKEVKTAFQFMLILDRPGDDHAFKIVLDTLDGFGQKTVENVEKDAAARQITLMTMCKILCGMNTEANTASNRTVQTAT